MAERAMKIVVINIVSLNPGDAAILQGSLRILHEAFGDAIDVTVYDRDGTAAARYYPWADFRPALYDFRNRNRFVELVDRWGWAHHLYRLERLRLHAAASLLKRGFRRPAHLLLSSREAETLDTWHEADLIISNGGTYLVPHYNLLRPILNCELALALDRPLVFFPQSLGPFEDTHFRTRLQRLFARASRIIVRDERSAQHLRSLGIPEDLITVSADAAFALALVPGERTPDTAPQKLRIAVSVRAWTHFVDGSTAVKQENYQASIAAAVTHLVRRYAAEVTFVSTCQGMPEYWTDDASYAQSIVARLEPDVASRTSIDPGFRQPSHLMEELARYDVVVATRMHAAILALCAGVPVLPIAYEFKTRELFRAMGLEQWVTDIDSIDAGSFVARLDAFLEQLDDVRHVAGAAASERRDRTEEMVPVLRQLVSA